MMVERVQKVIAQSGMGSRRACELWIKEGRVKINGKRAKLGDKVSPTCKIFVDNKLVGRAENESLVMLYHKPLGEVCSHQPEPHQRSMYASLPKPPTGRWLSVGRLDLNTSGLIILTNDGELLQTLQHPKFGHRREYRVRAFGTLNASILEKLKGTLQLEDGPARFKKFSHDISKGPNHWFTITLSEGRNRLVRRMFESLGLEVNRLIRTRFGKTVLPSNLKPGQYKYVQDFIA